MQLKDPSLLKEQCLIDGAWVGTPKLEVRNPATGALVARVPDLTAKETRAALEARWVPAAEDDAAATKEKRVALMERSVPAAEDDSAAATETRALR